MTHPSVDSEDDVIEARYADPEDVFYLEWGRETLKQTPTRLADALQRIIALASALLGGTMFFVASDVVPPHFRAAAMLLFLTSLSFAFYGLTPHAEELRLNSPEAVRQFKLKVIIYRERWLWNSSWSLAIGFYIAVLGAMLRVVNLM